MNAAPMPTHVTLPLAELKDVMKRGSPRHTRCAGCRHWVVLPQDRSWCNPCNEKYKAVKP